MSWLRLWAKELKATPSRLAFRRQLATRKLTPPRGELALNYGGVLEGGGLVHGGKVKLLHLRDAWPERDAFNLLYLVSSATPPHALELVKWARSRGAKLVWNQNGVGFPAWAGAHSEEFNRPMRALLREADFVVYQSDFCQRSADRFLARSESRSEVLFNPVDLSAFAPAPEPPPLSRWELLAAGTHQELARVTTAIDALSEILRSGQAARLTLAGRFHWPRGEEQVRAAIQRAGVEPHVRIVPAFAQADAPQLYRASHVLLHPKFNDPCPTVPIESLACGVPVIGSASGGMPELVDETSGELLPVEQGYDRADYPSAIEFAAAIAKVMAGWETRSRAARERAERLFDHRAWVARHRAIFESLIA